MGHTVEQEERPQAYRKRVCVLSGLVEGQTCFGVLPAVQTEVVHGMQNGSWKEHVVTQERNCSSVHAAGLCSTCMNCFTK